MGRIISWLLLLIVVTNTFGQTELEGIINAYASITNINPCTNIIVIDDASSFESGENILIYQAQGAGINSSNSGNFGVIESLNGAGSYEINAIEQIAGNVITLSFSLINEYNVNEGSAQVVSFPTYSEAIVKEPLTAAKWDGQKGGVIALQVDGTLTLEAPIQADGLGFRGGVSQIDVTNECGEFPNFLTNRDDYYYNLNNWRGSTKGEGIAPYISGREAGRGPQANGGGGGNDHNTGGGGGANRSDGGNGSRSDAGCRGRFPGIGGRAVTASQQSVFFGGGGGAGHENNKMNTAGGNGGGMIFLIANEVIANGQKITANGITPELIVGDGAGGGGGGGTIVLDVENITGNLSVEAKGGDGGSEDSRNGTRCLGPGGGGSGGLLSLTNNLSITANLAGGLAGQSLNSGNCDADLLIAQNGRNGLIFNNNPLVRSTQAFLPLSINAPTQVEVCAGEAATITPATTGTITQYQWQVNNGQGFQDLSDDDEVSGSNTPSLTIKNADSNKRYRLMITGICGDTQSSNSIRLQPQALPQARFDFIIDGQSVDFINNTGNGDEYFWDFGDGDTSTEGNPGHTYDTDGEYLVRLLATNECGTTRDSALISILPALSAGFNFAPEQGCIPLTVQFTNNSSAGAEVIAWQFPGGEPAASSSENPVVQYGTPGSFSASLIVSDGIEFDTLTRTNIILTEDKPQSSFQHQANELAVTFSNNSSDATSYLWDFGDGTTSQEANPQHSYPFGGEFIVKLISTNACGNDTVSTTLQVFETPAALFNIDQPEGCAPHTVQFSDRSTGTISARAWQFPGGNPSTSTDANPIVTYQDAGTYTATLIVRNELMADTLSVNDINIRNPTIADFSFTVNELMATFTNQSAHADNYRWDFGDGSTSNASDPSHQFPSDGQFTVQLISSNECSSDTLIQGISLRESPLASFSYDRSSGCTPLTIGFKDESSGTITERMWLFPGGSPASSTELSPTVTYEMAGVYEASLIVGNETAKDTFTVENIRAIDPVAAGFEFTTNELSVTFANLSQNAASARWDFGDGTNSIASDPVHIYAAAGEYTVQLISENECSSDTVNQVLTVRETPVALFSADPNSGCAPLTVTFNDLSSGTISNRWWEFPGGDPLNSAMLNPVVTYESPGIYSAALFVGNEIDQDSIRAENLILVEASAEAAAIYETDELRATFFNNSIASDEYLWDFGDGNISEEPNPVHLYDTSGTYTVLLISRNACSQDSFRFDVRVQEALRVITQSNKNGGCAPTTIQFDDLSTGSVSNRTWLFPGGQPSSSTERSPQVRYETPGVFNVILTIANESEEKTDTLEVPITIVEVPQPAFVYQLNGLEVQFTNLSESAYTFGWDFGDGNQSMLFNPIHTYGQSGIYDVTLNAQNEFCASAVSQQLMINLTDVNDEETVNYIRIYPNPTQDKLTVEHNLSSLPVNIEILSTDGRLMMQAVANDLHNTYSLSFLPQGIYWVRIRGADVVFSDKIIKVD